MLNLTQLALIIPLDGNQCVDILCVVLALQGVDTVQPVINAGEFGRIVVEGVNDRRHSLGDVFQLDEG